MPTLLAALAGDSIRPTQESPSDAAIDAVKNADIGFIANQLPRHPRHEQLLRDCVTNPQPERCGFRTPVFSDAKTIDGWHRSRALDRHRLLSPRSMHRLDVLAMVKRRALTAGISTAIGCHTFRVVMSNRHHNVLEEWWHAGTCTTHRQPRVSSHNWPLRPAFG